MENKPKSLRLCFERISGAHINDAKEFDSLIRPLIEDETVNLRFAGYTIMESGNRIGNCGHPCWQYIIDGDFESPEVARFVFNFEAPAGYAVHFFTSRVDENEKFLTTIA